MVEILHSSVTFIFVFFLLVNVYCATYCRGGATRGAGGASAPPTLLLSNYLLFSAKKCLYHCMKIDVIQPENLQAISLNNAIFYAVT